MKIQAINKTNSATRTGKRIGAAAGIGLSGAYLIKNRKDIFENALNSALNNLKEHNIEFSRNKALGITIGVCAVGSLIVTGIGRLIGGLIGKAVDKHNEKKALKNLEA